MKKLFFILSIFLIGIFSSCSTTYVVKNYPQDDIYYSSKDVKVVSEEYDNPTENKETIVYEEDNYYDYSYTARIRRFHSPYFYSSYYSDWYTDLYWYNYDPYFYGTSIYTTYPWLWPNYGYFYWGYTPSYYYWHYYHNYWWNPYYPYYLGNVYWGYNHWNNHYWNYYENLNNVYYGPRGNHMTSTNNGMNIRPPRTQQGGKYGVGKNTNQTPKKYDSKPVQKYSKPNDYNQERTKKENYKKYPTRPKTYVSPQYSRSKSAYEYVAPSTERRPSENRNSGENNKHQYNQEKKPSYTPSPAPSRSTPSPSNSGKSSGTSRQSKNR